MSTLTPMFDKKPKTYTLGESVKSERKQRSDKKKQIKVPVTEEEKLQIGRMSLQCGHRGEIHSYLAEVFSRATERPYVFYSKVFPYKNNRMYVSTKVNMEIYEKILELKVAWGCSLSRAAHRILINELLGG